MAPVYFVASSIGRWPQTSPYIAQSMLSPASINRDYQCYVNAIEDQRKQKNAALTILTSTLSASMNELSARLTEHIQLLAVTITQNKEEAKLEKEAAKQEKAQEKLERKQLRDHDFNNQFNQTMYSHIRDTLPDAKHSLLTQTCHRTMAELNASHLGGHLIVLGNPSHAFAVSDLITQDDSHTVTSTVSASTNHDFDTQQSNTADEWNKVPGNRNSPSDSESTRSQTSSPVRDNGVTTSNQYDTLSGN